MMNKTNFLYPHHRYHGRFAPENLMFNANLQEFAQKVSYIANLETGGKISPVDACNQIEALWEAFQHSTEHLGIR